MLSALSALRSRAASVLGSCLSQRGYAVPKKKSTHASTRQRAANKGLPIKQNIHQCAGCGHPKLLHHICDHCYDRFKNIVKLAQANGISGFI